MHMARLRKTCPKCKGRNVAKMLYGYVKIDEGLQRELEEGRTVLGGCVVCGNEPAQMCHDCGADWGKADL